MKTDVVLTITSEDQRGHIAVQTVSHTSTFISGKKVSRGIHIPWEYRLDHLSKGELKPYFH